MHFMESNRLFRKSIDAPNQKFDEQSFSTPHPGCADNYPAYQWELNESNSRHRGNDRELDCYKKSTEFNSWIRYL